MTKEILLRWDKPGVLLVAALYFLTFESVIPLFLYQIVAIGVTCMIFPGKFLLLRKENLLKGKEMIWLVCSDIIIASIVTTSMFYFDGSSVRLDIFLGILRLLNIFFSLYFVYKQQRRQVLLCICALLIPAGYLNM